MLGNHAGHNRTVEKRQLMIQNPEGTNPFIDPSEWKRYLDTVKNRYEIMLEKEEAGVDLIEM